MENVKATMCKEFSEIRQEINYCKNEIEMLKQSCNANNVANWQSFADINDTSFPPLPIQSLEDLGQLENAIQNNKEMETFLLKLSTIGGTTLRSVVNNIMNKTISREVATQFSLLGKKGKKCFKDLKLFTCVLGKISNIVNLKGNVIANL